MNRTTIEFYAAAVCFAAVACLAIALGNLLYNTVALLDPLAFALTPPLTPVPSPALAADGESVAGQGVQAAATAQGSYTITVEVATQHALTSVKRSLLGWSIAGVISGCLFYLHWRLLHREERPRHRTHSRRSHSTAPSPVPANRASSSQPET